MTRSAVAIEQRGSRRADSLLIFVHSKMNKIPSRMTCSCPTTNPNFSPIRPGDVSRVAESAWRPDATSFGIPTAVREQMSAHESLVLSCFRYLVRADRRYPNNVRVYLVEKLFCQRTLRSLTGTSVYWQHTELFSSTNSQKRMGIVMYSAWSC